MKRLFIEPLDVLMFRSERPFVARESHVAKLGVISPLTFEGAIKSKILLDFCEKRNYYSPSDFQRVRKREETEEEFKISLENLKKDVKEKVEEDCELKELLETIGYSPLGYPPKLNVVGVFFSRRERIKEYFPVPKDIVRTDDGKETLKLNPVLDEGLKIPGTEEHLCVSSYSKVEEVGGLISFDTLAKYLKGEKPSKSEILPYPYKKEIRAGIKLEKHRKVTVEGHLYTAEFLRLEEEWGFVVWIEDEYNLIDKHLGSNGDKTIIRLGGEGKGAICKRIEDINLVEKLKLQELIKEVNSERKFKLYLATSTHLNGYKPPKDLEEELKKELGVNDLQLVTSLPGKPIYVGGYDFAVNKEKPLQRWVDAGAVYYYKFEGKIKEDLD
ncbi:MAG: type III-B CRISPR module-associated protein Cmr3, partial [Thaumarchaeota archaeon]